MKKMMTNMKTLVALLMAGAAVTSCSSDNEMDSPKAPAGKTYTMTVQATKGGDATTRALADGGDGTLTATWATTENVYVKKDATWATGSLKPQADGATATLKGELSGVTIDAGDKLTMQFPKSGDITYAGQKGTLADIAENFDWAIAENVQVTSVDGDGNIDTGKSAIEFQHQQAVVKFTLMDKANTSTKLNPTALTINDGTSDIVTLTSIPAETYTTNGEGVLYVALPAVSSKPITLTATVGSDTYTLTTSSPKTFTNGSFYHVTAKMAVAVSDLSMLDCAGLARASRWTANCYMVHTAGNYKLPLVYGNAIKNGATNAAAYTGVSGQLETFPRHDGSAITGPWIKDNDITVTQAELLWQDAEGLITNVGIDGDYLTLTVGKDADTQEGNAVVAAKDGSGNIVWSWHIWVTKQTFAAADLTTVATGSHDYKVTPVNLGWVGDDIYTGTNTFYQWGRKDPFKGTGSVTYSTSSATIADNIKNPTTFYIVSEKPNTSTAYNLWDAKQTGTDNIATATVKTVYDPSPAGFCVPTGNLYYYFCNGNTRSMSTWDSPNKGATWNLDITGNALFFPASGRRNWDSGSLAYVGSYGYFWSASAYGSNANYACNLIYFSSSWSWYYSRRSYGFPVRAVAEE